MNDYQIEMNRRQALKFFGVSSLFLLAPGIFAEQLSRTPRQAEGPFYPDRMPLDRGNDLLKLGDSISLATGVPLYLKGHVLDVNGKPYRNALVEIWQCDANGRYIHSRDFDKNQNDLNFQGYGRFQTGSKGEYFFRTIKPVAYGSGWGFRTPHIHFKVTTKGKKLTTQMYIAGDPMNAKDSLWRSIRKPKLRDMLTIPLTPLANSKIAELTGNFTIIV